jgi:hypothetical protein
LAEVLIPNPRCGSFAFVEGFGVLALDYGADEQMPQPIKRELPCRSVKLRTKLKKVKGHQSLQSARNILEGTAFGVTA